MTSSPFDTEPDSAFDLNGGPPMNNPPPRWRGLRHVAAAWVMLWLSAGCGGPNADEVEPSPSSDPIVVTSETINLTLPTTEYIQTLFPDAEIKPDQAPTKEVPYGTYQDMKSGPRECLGIANTGMTQRSAQPFHPQKYRGMAWQIFPPKTIGSVEELRNLKWPGNLAVDVTTFKDSDTAERAFAEFAHDWKSCEGKFVTEYRDTPFRTSTVIDVRDDITLLNATLSGIMSDAGAFVSDRALGVQGNCIIEVAALYGVTGVGAHAVEIARHMMDTISELGE